jgi:hypothetical protein
VMHHGHSTSAAAAGTAGERPPARLDAC